jgi:hypothetical protein
MEDRKVIHFNGAGLGFPYMFGVGAYLQDNEDLYNLKDCIFSGMSAGSFAASYLAYGISLEEMQTEHVTSLFSDVQEKGLMKWNEISGNGVLNSWNMVDPNAYKKLNEKNNFQVYIGNCVSLFDIRSEKVTNFESNEDLVSAMMTSAFVPYAFGGSYTKKYRDKYYIDGVAPFVHPFNKTVQERPVHDIDISLESFGNSDISWYLTYGPDWSMELFNKGYTDASNHPEFFDKIRFKE